MASIYSHDPHAHRDEETFRRVEFLEADIVRKDDPTIDALLTYFEKRTGGTRLPSRKDVSPKDLKLYLPEICLIEPQYGLDTHVVDARLLLQGTAVVSFYGEMTGRLASSHPNTEVGERIIASCQKCIDGRAPIVASAQALSRDKFFLKLLALYIPLSSDGESIDRLFVHVNVQRHSRQ